MPLLRPSQLAEVITEIELEGYTIFGSDRDGWNAEILGERMLDIPARSKEDCALIVHGRLLPKAA